MLKSLYLVGNLVPVDANGCRPALCKHVLEEKGDYLIGLKRNNLKLYVKDEELFAGLTGQVRCYQLTGQVRRYRVYRTSPAVPAYRTSPALPVLPGF